jgi:hypothetical protein
MCKRLSCFSANFETIPGWGKPGAGKKSSRVVAKRQSMAITVPKQRVSPGSHPSKREWYNYVSDLVWEAVRIWLLYQLLRIDLTENWRFEQKKLSVNEPWLFQNIVLQKLCYRRIIVATFTSPLVQAWCIFVLDSEARSAW